MEKKYELIEQKNGLCQVRALRDFSWVSKGSLGGYVQSEKNLSHEGNCWIDPRGVVLENAVVSENAYIGADSVINGNAQIRGKATVSHSYASETPLWKETLKLIARLLSRAKHISTATWKYFTQYFREIFGKRTNNGHGLRFFTRRIYSSQHRRGFYQRIHYEQPRRADVLCEQNS